jgi:hypothetical protein
MKIRDSDYPECAGFDLKNDTIGEPIYQTPSRVL